MRQNVTFGLVVYHVSVSSAGCVFVRTFQKVKSVVWSGDLKGQHEMHEAAAGVKHGRLSYKSI